MSRYSNNYRGFSMRPQWGEPHSMDPNWRDGQYHGNRMQYDHRHGAYGWHRANNQQDLRSHGGFDGIYDEGQGSYDQQGIYHHPHFEGGARNPRSAQVPRAYGYGDQYRHVENGGVQRDTRYLGQYNANSPALRYGRDYDRSYGQAPGARGEGQYTPESARYRTNERGYAGYNRGGFAPQDRGPGLDPRK